MLTYISTRPDLNGRPSHARRQISFSRCLALATPSTVVLCLIMRGQPSRLPLHSPCINLTECATKSCAASVLTTNFSITAFVVQYLRPHGRMLSCTRPIEDSDRVPRYNKARLKRLSSRLCQHFRLLHNYLLIPFVSWSSLLGFVLLLSALP